MGVTGFLAMNVVKQGLLQVHEVLRVDIGDFENAGKELLVEETRQDLKVSVCDISDRNLVQKVLSKRKLDPVVSEISR